MRFYSLRFKLISASIFLILIPILAVGVIAYNELEKVVSTQIESVTSDRLNQVNRNIERQLLSMMNASRSIVLDENVRFVLNRPPSSERERQDNVNMMDKKIMEISTAILTDSFNLTIFDQAGNFYTNWSQRPDSYDNMYNSEWFQKALDRNGYMVWEMNADNYVFPYKGKLVTLAMRIKDNLTKDMGVLVISQPEEAFSHILKMKDGSIGNLGFIVGPQGKFIGENTKLIEEMYPLIESNLESGEESYTTTLKGEETKVLTNSIALTDWKTVHIVPHKEIFKQIDKIRTAALLTIIVSLTIFILLIYGIGSMITRSLRKLGAAMKQVESGDLDVSFHLNSRDEVALLTKSFNHMLRNIRHYIDNEILLERSKEKAKLEALQAQINPHFLHNTLNTIKWMSIMAGTKNITEMLLSLGHLLNTSIHRGQETITLEEEMANVRYFLTIQKYRFGDTIEVHEEIESSALASYVPKLSLQPLVENVYQHGLFIQGGTMIIRVRRQVDDLYLEVIDNGIVSDMERINGVRDRLDTDKPDGFSGIGLKNVHKRIQMMYGTEFGLDIQRDDNKGVTCVFIRLPFGRKPM